MAQKPNEVQTVDQKASSFIQKFSVSLDGYALREYDKTSFRKSAMLAIVNNNNLAACLDSEKGRVSLFNAMRFASATGLSLNPQEGKAALIGYKNKQGETIINYQIMSKGMIQLVLETGKVELIQCDFVKEKDIFTPKKTASGDDYDFLPALKDRGEIIGFFASLKFKDGPSQIKWMTREEVEEHRDKYSKMYKVNKNDSPWEHSFAGMGLKTVVKALLRSVNISEDIGSYLDTDNFMEIDLKPAGVSAEDALKKMEEKKTTIKEGELL